jgi:mono/diheme cytochrome c family protein
MPTAQAPRILSALIGAVLAGPVLAAPILAAASTDAGPPTFYRDVLPVLQANCQECHRPSGANYGGMRAPMAFSTFEETRPWAKSIALQVASREMPPWDADARHNGTFANERVLSEGEIETLVRWASSGAAAGEIADAPPPRTFEASGGWLIGEPDLVVAMPEPYFVADEVEDLYAAFSVVVTEEMLPEDRWVIAFQCQPDSDVIHHFNLHLLEPGADGALPPPPEFPQDGQIAPQGAGRYMGGVSSGTEANRYPPGYGFLLKRGSRVTFDIHYHKEPGAGTGVWDRSTIGFKFVDGPLKDLNGGLTPMMNFTFAIPANDPSYQVGPIEQVATHDVDVIALMPHMHMRGKAAKFEAFYPDGTSEILLEVPRYDFSWQTVYYFEQIKRIPKGTRVEYTAWYDNSPEKAARYGFDASETVRFGQPSTAEMMMGFLMSARAE